MCGATDPVIAESTPGKGVGLNGRQVPEERGQSHTIATINFHSKIKNRGQKLQHRLYE